MSGVFGSKKSSPAPVQQVAPAPAPVEKKLPGDQRALHKRGAAANKLVKTTDDRSVKKKQLLGQ